MEPRFDSGRQGRAISYQAFVPEPIAGLEVRFTGPLVQLVSETESAISALNADPPGLVPLEGMARQLLRAEALASSAIEGLQLSQKRLARASLHPEFDFRAREILNNISSLEQAVRIGQDGALITDATLQDIHRTLARRTRLARWGGVFRDEPGWIGGTNPTNAEYVPPPKDEIPRLRADLLAFINDRDDLPPLLHAAIAHAQFEAIHMFPDGNGRVGRCLVHSILIRDRLTPRYVPPVSVVLGARRERYMEALSTFQKQGGVEPWCEFFMIAARDATDRAKWFADQVDILQRGWRERITARRDSAVWSLIEVLPAQPVIDARTAEALTGRTFPAANNAIEALETAGILVRHDNRKKGRSWEAPDLLDLLKRFEVELSSEDIDE